MTPLSKQIVEVSAELQTLAAGEDNRRIIDEVEAAIEQLAPAIQSLAIARNRRVALVDSDVALDPGAYDALERASRKAIVKAFTALRDANQANAAKIRQSGVSAKFVNASRAFEEALNAHNEQAWHEWVDSRERSFQVTDAELNSIENVLDYAADVARYRERRQRFSALVRVVPSTASDVAAVVEVADELTRLRAGFRFDLPAPVVRFFDELSRTGSLPLKQVPESVMTWLRDNQGLDDLMVSRRSRMLR
jgi:hypothetical protein